MHFQDRTIAERGRPCVVDRPPLRKNARVDGLAVLAGSRPYPGAIIKFKWQVGDPEVWVGSDVSYRIDMSTDSIRIEPIEELPDIVIRTNCREVVGSNGRRVRCAGQIDRLRVSRDSGGDSRGIVGKDKSRANNHPHIFEESRWFRGRWLRVYQRVRLARSDLLLIAKLVEFQFGACRPPLAKVFRPVLRCRIKRKHPGVARRRVSDELNLADKSPGLRRRPEEDERIRRRLGSAARWFGFPRCSPFDVRSFVDFSEPGAPNVKGLIS